MGAYLPPHAVWSSAPVAQAKFSEVIFRDHTVITRGVELYTPPVYEVVSHEQQLTAHLADLKRRVTCWARIKRPVECNGAVAVPTHRSDAAPLSLPWTRKDDDSMTSRLR